jgi:hypothetical protein
MPFTNNHMVNTRSRGGQDIPLVVRAHIANQQNPVPPPLTQSCNGSRNAAILCRPNATDPEPHCRSAKSASSVESATASSTTSPKGQI